MPVTQLLDGDLDAYFRDEADKPDSLWIFHHIPKTAGSSFRSELARRLEPNTHIRLDYSKKNRDLHQLLDESTAEFLELASNQKLRFASGHLRWRQIVRIDEAIPSVKWITMLRDPVARMISDYRYSRTPLHAEHRDVIAKYPRFEDYLDDPVNHDRMWRYLFRPPNEPVEELIARLDRDYSFVGTVELYSLCCRILFRLIGDEALPSLHQRKTESLADNHIPNLPELLPRVASCNQKDLRIYEHFSGRLEALRERLEHWLEAPSLNTPATPRQGESLF